MQTKTYNFKTAADKATSKKKKAVEQAMTTVKLLDGQGSEA